MELKKYKLADIGKVITGKTPSTSIAENYAWGTIPFYTPEDVAKGLGMMGRNSRFISKTGFEEIASNTISGESVLVGCIGSDMGNVAYSNITCATNQQINAITQFKNGIEPLYVYYLLSTMKSYFQKIAGSTTTPILPKSVFEEIEIHLPDMKKQKDVVSILYALDRKIELNKQINDNLEAMAKQLYDYWFVQFDFPNEEGKPYKSSGGAMVWNEKLKREIPQGWSNGVLSDVANITMGQSPDGSSYNEDGEGIIFYQGSTDFGLRFPDIRQYTTSPSRYANKGDFLMSVSAPVGALNIANNDCCIGRGLSALSSKIGSMTHLYYLMNDFRLKFEGMNSAGTTFGSITKDELFSLPVIIPTKTVISEFEQVCEPIFDKQMIIGEEINALTKQRDELLPLLMNGQATVNYHLSDSFTNYFLVFYP